MVSHRIKQFRTWRGISQEELGRAIGRSKSVISRLEDGSTKLDLDTARKIAVTLDVPLEDVVGIEASRGPVGFAEDIKAYTEDDSAPLRHWLGPNRYAASIETNLLDNLHITIGDTVVIDDSAQACRNVEALKPVLVLYHPPQSTKAVRLLRQFVPPRLLVTNSASEPNVVPLETSRDDAHIVGVIVHVHRSFTN